MLKDVISQGDYALYPSVAVLIFALTFAFILYKTTRPKAADHYRSMASLALDDDEREHCHD
jgi:hypothetical protein